MPRTKADWFAPVIVVLFGMAIGLSPDGKVPRMAIALGEYRDAVALLFIAFGIALFFMTGYAKKKE
ncbi:MAG: hypothetical protein ACREO0_00595 [Pseudoxanthomonas sp.]